MKRILTTSAFLKRGIHFALLYFFSVNMAFAQSVTVTVNATQDKRLISPYIYGRNESFDHSVQFYKDAGLHFARTNGGNNASGYYWPKRLSVHPDWYNNVYVNDWDAAAKTINDNFSDMQGMFAFQLLGRVASNNQNNFNDWAYNQSQWWSGVGQNLAGGGVPNPDGGSTALVDGDINLFSKPWPADSSVAILNYWFGTNGKGFNKNKFVYWSMDNEVDIWNGTHDWAMPTQLSASAFMDRYIELAKKAKALYPGIKLCGPVTTSEWQWYKWSTESIYINGVYYCWLEYFIKRLGDEYKATGIKLVDVVDIHNYPWYNSDNAAALQGHRIYYDETYDYPGSNGIKTINGGWDNSLTKQYIFKRINDWLTEHFGTNHGITAGISEWGTMTTNSNPNIESVIYASHLGTFANNGVELFSPWNWSVGMWETLHLFSKNAKKYSVSSTSSLETTVSAYSSINEPADSMTIIIVNRDMYSTQNVTVNLTGFTANNGNYTTLQLSGLPSTETFVSHSQNALKASQVSVSSNSFTINVPALSTTAVILNSCTPTTITPYIQVNDGTWQQTGNVTVTSGAKVKFGPQPVSGGSWSWTGCGTSGTSREQTVYPTSSCTATATYTNSNGCKSTYTFNVTVLVCTPTTITPYIQVNDGTWQQTSSVTVTSGAKVKFGPQPVSTGSWSWTGCGTSGTSREQTVYPTSSCTATATYTNSTGCQSTQNFSVTVGSSNYPIVVRAKGTTGSEAVRLTVGGTQVAAWTMTTSLTDYSASTSLGGAINVEFTNDNGSRDVQIDYITVNGTTYQAENQATNTAVWNGSSCGGSYSEWLQCNGYIAFSAFKSALIEQNSNIDETQNVIIYPNPFTNSFNLEVSNPEEVLSVIIYDMLGNRVETFDNAVYLNEKSMGASLKSGMYVVQVYGSSWHQSFRIIKN